MMKMENLMLNNLNSLRTSEVTKKFNVEKAIKMVYNGILILPDFQRGSVYTPFEKTNIVLTALIDKEPLTSSSSKFLVVTDGKILLLADGQQRITAIFHFLKDHPVIKERFLRWSSDSATPSKLLNLELSEPILKFKIDEKNFPHLKGVKQEMKGKTCLDFSNEVIEAFLDLELNFVFKECEPEDLTKTCLSVYNIFNAAKPLTHEEKQFGKNYDNEIFVKNFEFMYSRKFVESVFYKQENRFKSINFGIDTFNYINDLYQSGSHVERNDGYLKLNDDLSIKRYDEVMNNALNVAKKIFPEGYCFSEVNRYGKFKKMTLASFMPWVVAITDTLITESNPNGKYTFSDFENFSKSILEEWSMVNIPTGKNVSAFVKNGVGSLPNWCELSTNNSNNKSNVDMRIKTIKNIFAYCIQNTKKKVA